MSFGKFRLGSNKAVEFSIENLKDNVKREDVAKNSNLQAIFDIFDSQIKDGVISSDRQGKNELKSIFEQLNKMDKNSDGILDNTEANQFIQKFLPNTDVTSNDLFEFLASLIDTKKILHKPEIEQLENKSKTEEEIRAGVIESLRADTNETFSLLQHLNNGKVSEMYDSMKEFFNSDTSSAKVMEAAINQAQSAKYMEKAQAGELTMVEYIKENRERLKKMITNRLYKKDKDGVDYIDKYRQELNMSRKEFEELMLATIKRITDNMDINQIKAKMQQLPLATDADDKSLMDSVKQNAIVLHNRAKSAGYSNLDIAIKYIQDIESTALPSPDDDRLLSFEEVFSYEQGVNYSKEACEEYLNNKAELTRNLSAYNKYLEFKTGTDSIIKEKDAEKALNELIALFENYYSNPLEPNLAYDRLKSIVKTSNLPINVIQDETGKILISVQTGSEEQLLSYVSDILSIEGKVQEERLNKIFNGNAEEKLSELQAKVESEHEKAYGNDFSSTLGKAMIEDNHTFIQRYTGGASMIGMGLMVVGGVLCVTPAAALGSVMVTSGQTLAMTGMAAESVLGYTEAVTREHGAEDGEYAELTKNLIMNAGGFIVGFGAGKAGNMAFQKLINKKLTDVLKINITKGNRAAALKQVFSDKELLYNFMKAGGVKISSDFLISYAGDLVMMGVLNTDDDWMLLLKSNLMGIMVGTTGDIGNVARLSNKGKIDETLVKKEKEGEINGKGLTPEDTTSRQVHEERGETTIQNTKSSTVQDDYIGKIDNPDRIIGKYDEKHVSTVESFKEQLNLDKISYEVLTDKDGNTYIKLVVSAERKDAASGVKYTYDCYKYDKNGNIIDLAKNISDKEIKSKYRNLKQKTIVDNSDSSTSDNVYVRLIPIPSAIRNLFNKLANDIIKPGQLERKETNLFSNRQKSLDVVMNNIKYVCQKYGYDYNFVVKNFMHGLDIELRIFDAEENLNKYINRCIQLYNVKDKHNLPAYNKHLYNFRHDYIDHSYVDLDMVRDIALLSATDSNMSAIFDRVCFVYEHGNIDQFSMKKIIKYLKEGYITPETLTVCLDTGLMNQKHFDLGNIVDAKLTDNKLAIKAREQVLHTIERLSPEHRYIIRELISSLGNDVYRIKWDCLDLSSLEPENLKSFIADAKNLIHLKNIELTPDNFYIKIGGYGKNEKWAREMVDITEQASSMISEGKNSDDILSYIASETRSLSLSQGYNHGRATSQGVLRVRRDGYMYDSKCEEYGAITSFETNQYSSYAEQFRYRAAHPLNNPYKGTFELTVIGLNEDYPIDASRYNPNNPRHKCVVDANGNKRYYELNDSMLHPHGKYANGALNIVKTKQDDLINKYKGKTLSEIDLNIINEEIGEIHWILSHSMPWGRGSAGISQAYVLAIYQALGLKVYPPKEGVSFDLEAFCTELNDYKKLYKNYYEKPPEIAK